MKKIFIIPIIVTLFSCNPFNEARVLNYKNELIDLVQKFEKKENGSYDRDEIDEFMIGDIRKLDIDLVVINKGKKNINYSGLIEENDSLIIFINKSNNIIDNEKRIIYDFKKNLDFLEMRILLEHLTKLCN